MLYAITINPGHEFYRSSCEEVLHVFILEMLIEYGNIVYHSNDHFHALISLDSEIKKEYASGKFHFETIRNSMAYIKYMYNHDVTDSIEMGELPYCEPDSIVDFILLYGPQKAVQKYGWQALRQYKNIKEFYKDSKGGNYV